MNAKALGLAFLTAAAVLALGWYMVLPPAKEHRGVASCANDFAGTKQERSARQQGASCNAGPRVIETPADSGAVPKTARVRVLKQDDTPLAALKLKWECPVAKGLLEGEAVTDNDGRFELLIRKAGRLALESLDRAWKLPRDHLVTPGEELIVRPSICVNVKLLVVLADGTPFTGKATVREPMGPGSLPCGFIQYIYFKGADPVAIESIPAEATLVVIVEGDMLGYRQQKFTIENAELVDGRTIVLTLIKDENDPRGVIEVDMGAYSSKWIRLAVLVPGNPSEWAAGGPNQLKNGVWRSRPLPASTYVVRVMGSSTWESLPVVVERGKVTRIVTDNYLPASVSAVVLDEDGKPFGRVESVRGARLSRLTEHYLPERMVSVDEPGLSAFTDGTGRVELRELRPGLQKLVLEAPRTEPVFMDVNLMPGEKRDLGTIKLERAKGKAVVVLKGRRADYTYTVTIDRPQGESVRTVMETREAQLEFDGLAFRKYQVVVVAGMGGRPVVVEFEITAEVPSATAEIDVSSLEPSPRQK